MSFSLGQAKLILDANAEPLLTTTAKAYSDIQRITVLNTKFLADQNNVRVKDVKAAAAIIIAEEKKKAAELQKLAKQAAAEQKRIDDENVKLFKEQARIKAQEEKKSLAERLKNQRAAEREEQKLLNEKAKAQKAYRDAENRERIRLDREYKAAIRREEAEERRRQQQQTKQSGSRSNQSSSILGYNPKGIGGDIATIAGFGAIASGAILIREALIKLTEATLKQEQAQRSLNGAFGQTAILYKNNADQLAATFGKVSSEVEQATARFGVLAKQTVLTGEQIRKLNQVALDNQAAFGGDLEEAHRSLAGAILGETEAYEKYGVVLQEGVLKSSALLTEDERKRFTIMSESEKQLIRYRIIMQEASNVTGAAAQRARDAQGGFDLLNRSVDELAKSLGNQLVKEAGKAAGALGGLLEKINKDIKAADTEAIDKAFDQAFAERKARMDAYIAQVGWFRGVILGELDPNSPMRTDVTIEERVGQIRSQQGQEDKRKEETKRILAEHKERQENLRKAETEARDKQEAENRRRQQILEIQLERAHKANLERIDELIRKAEEQRYYELEAAEKAHEARLDQLEEQEREREKASKAELERIEKEKDAALDASEAKKDADLERIETEKEAAQAVAEQTIRNLEIERDKRNKANEDLRDAQLKEADNTRDSELARLEKQDEERKAARIKEDREINDSIVKKDRKLEDDHKKVLLRIELQGEKLRDKDEKENKALDKKIDKEAERHRKNMQRIEKEKDEALEIIDKQIDGIRAIQDARERARRRESIQDNITDAAFRLREATGTQNPQDRVAAQAKLVGAIRVGDPQAIKKAQDELLEIVGRGTKAVAEAQKDLRDEEQELRDNDLKNEEDAQIDKLEAQKKTVEKQKDIEREQEEERNRNREKRLQKDKDADDNRLEDALRKLERKQEAENKDYELAKRRADDLTEDNKRQLEDRRREEDTAHERSIESTRKVYDTAVEKARERYETEQEEIKETYDGEERGYIPAIRRALRETEANYRTQTEQVNARYKAEQKAIQENSAQLAAANRAAEADAKAKYDQIKKDVLREYEEIRKGIEQKYRAPDKRSGILDQYDEEKRVAGIQLDAIKSQFENHKLGLTGPDGIITLQWEEARAAAAAYFADLDAQLAKKRTSTVTVSVSTGGSVNPGSGATSNNDVGGDDPGQPSRRQSGSASSGSVQVGPDPGMPGSTTPDYGPGGGSGGGDGLGDKFQTSFGYMAPYNGQYTARPGWSGGAAWPGGPSHHKGIDLVPKNGSAIGSPVYAFYPGKVLGMRSDPSAGGNMLVIADDSGRTHWYMHLQGAVDNLPSRVNRGDHIAYMGESGTEGMPHLHYEVRNGDNNGPATLEQLRENGIDPRPFINGRDKGYLFKNPTLYRDMRTGERGILAERGPERLLGREQTAELQKMNISGIRSRVGNGPVDYAQIGAQMAYAMSAINETNTREGDKFVYNGVAPDDIMRQWRRDQRRQTVLRGRTNGR